MTEIEITESIVTYLKTLITDVNIEAHPGAVNATSGFYTFDSNGIILVWYNNTPRFEQKTKETTTGFYVPSSQISEWQNYVISVGIRSVNEKTDIDDYIADLKDAMINLYIKDSNTSPFEPVSISTLIRDINGVHWRQLYFNTQNHYTINYHCDIVEKK